MEGKAFYKFTDTVGLADVNAALILAMMEMR